MLDAAQRLAYQRDGFIVMPDFKSAAATRAAAGRARALVEAFEPGGPAAVFSSRDRARNSDAALLASAEQVHCFFEEEAFDDAGHLRVPKAQAINKIGHALHDLDPVFERYSHGPALAAMATGVGLAAPRLWQSQVIFKQPGIGGEVRWHQDASFFVTTPHSVTTFWFALEDATLDNGCLWVEPGGHRGPLREHFVRDAEALRIEPLDDTPWPDAQHAVPLEVAAGTLVVFHGLLPHWSKANRSPRSRLAYTLHVTDAACDYSARNWLQRSAALPVRGFL
jgi:phytanoyl-CoA hydroxylase